MKLSDCQIDVVLFRKTSRENSCHGFLQLHFNYISPSSTVRIQLHVSALYVGHL